MLRSTSPKAVFNIRKYIENGTSTEGYTAEKFNDFSSLAAFILKTFRTEKFHCAKDFLYYNRNEFSAFCDWCAGLPSVLDTCYFYNRSAVNDLGAVLEESEAEKSRFSESEAEKELTRLIYRELLKGAAKK